MNNHTFYSTYFYIMPFNLLELFAANRNIFVKWLEEFDHGSDDVLHPYLSDLK